MKKILNISLSILILIGLAGCSSGHKPIIRSCGQEYTLHITDSHKIGSQNSYVVISGHAYDVQVEPRRSHHHSIRQERHFRELRSHYDYEQSEGGECLFITDQELNELTGHVQDVYNDQPLWETAIKWYKDVQRKICQ